MGEFVVYVLYSSRYKKIYIGVSSDLINRFHSHNTFSKSGFTIKFRPWEVIHVEFFNSKSEALSREKQLKSARGRDYIHNKILCNY